MQGLLLKIRIAPKLLLLLTVGSAFCAPWVVAKPQTQPVQLTAEGEQALAHYQSMLAGLRAELAPQIPVVSQSLQAALLKADSNPKYSSGTARVEPTRAVLNEIGAFLASDRLDDKLVKTAVLSTATPRRLAAYVQQGPEQRRMIDGLLNNPAFMKEMLMAGGAKDGRYGRSLEIIRTIVSNSEAAKSGVLRRLALATALELAAPELCEYDGADPVARYRFFEQAYLNGELDRHFEQHDTWLYRHVVNDPHTNEDMEWMRDMLWNYRPDMITAPDEYLSRIVGLMDSEFGHKRPEWDPDASTSQLQQAIDRGGQCGPKARFGRCLGRSFGIPVWGARVKAHTAMTYWTPQSWRQILGVSWRNAFWRKDQPDAMRAWYFHLYAMLRDHTDAFEQAMRAQWIGEVLGQERVDRMEPHTGGFWPALSIGIAKATLIENDTRGEHKDPPWLTDTIVGKQA